MKRDNREEFSAGIKELLARRAGYQCSICGKPTVAAHSESDRSINLGEACHIYSAAPNGPRANPALLPEERSAARNGIHLCKLHARLIDVDVNEFTAETLRKHKDDHEARIRSTFLPPSKDWDPEFLLAHESQIRHGRGTPNLGNLWVERQVVPRASGEPIKANPVTLLDGEHGIILVTSDQGTGRTSLLKRIASVYLDRRTCIWLDGELITESVFRDPMPLLASGYRKLYLDADAWMRFLDGKNNLVLIDDFHLSPLNCASRRKFLALLHSVSQLVVVVVSRPFLIELLTAPIDDARVLQWDLLDLSYQACSDLAEKWCRYRAESIEDTHLDAQVATTQDQLEILFGRKLMPRQPVFVLTALQMLDAGAPVDTLAGSFGGVYEAVIHAALAHNAKNQASITSERSYLEELAYWSEFEAARETRSEFNRWFAERKGVHLSRVEEIERSLTMKGFLSATHLGFKFHYQKYYFLASFLRDNPDRAGTQDYIRKLIGSCWNEDFANTALFLAYLQPASPLVTALVDEVKTVLSSRNHLDLDAWKIEIQIPKELLDGLDLSATQPEANRRKMAERLDQEASRDESLCKSHSFSPDTVGAGDELLELIKGFHLIKLAGQLIRNSPIALDAKQKENLVRSAISLALRLADWIAEYCGPTELQRVAIGQLRDSVLKQSVRSDIEFELAGIACHLAYMLVFNVFRHACFYLAHCDLDLIFKRIFSAEALADQKSSYRLIEIGLRLELRSPDPDQLHDTYGELPVSGRTLLRIWAWRFLWLNRVPVQKRQAILAHLEMKSSPQLLLPHK